MEDDEKQPTTCTRLTVIISQDGNCFQERRGSNFIALQLQTIRIVSLKKKFQKEFRFFLTPLPQNTEMTHAFLAFTVGWKGKEGGRSCRRPSGCFRTMAKSQAANLTCQDSPLFVASYYAFSLSQTKGKDSFQMVQSHKFLLSSQCQPIVYSIDLKISLHCQLA